MERSALKYYDIDRAGWLGVCSALEGTHGRLEWADVQRDEYVVIDSDGYLYEAHEDLESRFGYSWQVTDRREVDVAVMLAAHVNGERLSEAELNFVR